MSLSTIAPRTLNDLALKEDLQRLRRTDNVTNWYYLARTYLFLALIVGGAVTFDLYRQTQGWSWLWSVPVFALAVLAVGAGQHQLSGLAHEGSHHILFANRVLNEIVSDWFCLYPLFSSTHNYRLQHLAHHQFVNDPLRDPDVSQLQTSGHWLHFPITRATFYAALLKQLWLPNLARFILVRGQYNATGNDKNPYMKKGVKQSKVAVRIGLVYLVSLLASLTWGIYSRDTLLLVLLPTSLYVVTLGLFAVLPAAWFPRSRLHPVLSHRLMAMLRITFLTLVFTSLSWVAHLTGVPAGVYYLLLWIVPIFTSFSFFMIMRQWVQHGNADRGWLTNTRTFFVNRLISYAVFPMGQDYHLPHHLYPTIPHYRLRELHEILLAYPEYQDDGVEVHGYFISPEKPQLHPTVVDVLGPKYQTKGFRGVHIEDSVLDDCKVDEKESILAEGAAEAKRLAEAAKTQQGDTGSQPAASGAA